MEQQDEIFEAIPWDRFTTKDAVARQRRWYVVAAVALAAGVLGFGLRRAPIAQPTTPVAAATPVPALTSTTTSTTSPLTEADLLASPLQSSSDVSAAAERFVVELLASSGATISNATAYPPDETTGETRVTVVTDLARTGEIPPDSVALVVTFDATGAVDRWEPTATPPTEVRDLTPGAEVPPDVLSELVRVAARWGTVIETRSSGLSDDTWWADLLIRLPSGRELAIVVWEK